VNKALVSRSRIFQLNPLQEEDLEQIINFALADRERGYGDLKIDLAADARNHLVRVAIGDARALLNALELAVVTSKPDGENHIFLDLAVAEESIQQKAILYDKDGDVHFDTISAFIKSLRGSDPDAALYWMAKMVYGGEDPRFILRRMIIFAGEDIGMADPHALQVVMSAAQAFDYVGMPEGRFHLSEACLYLATAPKSNSGFAFFDALQSVQKAEEGEMPNHLRDANRDKEGFGHGKGYLYPHAYHDHWVPQQYLPQGMQGKVFYQPTEQGYEAQVREQVVRRREAQLAAMLEYAASEGQTQSEQWKGRTLGNTGEILGSIRDHLFGSLSLERSGMILILHDGSGLLSGEALRQVPEGTVYVLVDSAAEETSLKRRFLHLEPLLRPIILCLQPQDGVLDLGDLARQGLRFDAVLGRSVLSRYPDKAAVVAQIGGILSKKGVLVLAENVPADGQRLSEYLAEHRLDADLRKRLLVAEAGIYLDSNNTLTNWSSESLLEVVRLAGFRIEKQTQTRFLNEVLISAKKIEDWFTLNKGDKASYADQLQKGLTLPEIEKVKGLLTNELAGKMVQWKTTWLFFKAIW